MKIAILGGGGHGKVIADLAELLGYTVVFFDELFPQKKKVEHWPVMGDLAQLLIDKQQYVGAVVAIGDNKTRQQLSQQLLNANIELLTLVHPTAVVSCHATIGSGSVVFAGAVINAFAVLGDAVIVNSGAIVEHDCSLADGVHISPNVALGGGTKVGFLAWVGIGANTRQGAVIGDFCIVGAGATVIKDIPAKAIAFGTPARATEIIHD